MPPRPALSELSAAQRQRLAYIEFRVRFYGQVSRKDILKRFGLAPAAGTRDLALYRALAPDNVAYERKAYHFLPSFSPRFSYDTSRVLSMLTRGFGMGEPAIDGELVSHAIPSRLNQPNLQTLATITRAIAHDQALRLTYYSIADGPGHREILPHSLVDSGVRWHVRAFDRTKGRFWDLVLNRIVQPTPIDGADAKPARRERMQADAQWNRQLTLDFVPHPAQPHPGSIERDLGMKNGRLTVTVRAAVAGYMLRQWQVDCSPDASLARPEFRLWLANTNQLEGVANAVLAPGYQDSAAPT